jgi:hypothetical protein
MTIEQHYTAAKLAKTQSQFMACLKNAAKLEILGYVANGIISSDVCTFGELHDYVDANEFGGLCRDDISAKADELFPHVGEDDDGIASQAFMVASNELQDELNAWIITGGLKVTSHA